MRSLAAVVLLFQAARVCAGVTIDARRIDPGMPNELAVRSTTPANVTVTFPPSLTVQHVPDECRVNGSTVICANATTIPITFFAEEQTPDSVTVTANDAAVSLLTNQLFNVTNTNDSGAGSLRAAMEAANTTDCARSGRCKVAFRLGVPPSPGWFTISLQSPLPAMRPMLSIDGTTQTRLFGDTNPAGPEIFLDGSRLTQGNGVVFESAEVVSLAIGNFPNAGILITRPPVAASEVIVAKVPREIHACYIGVAPDGETAAPNERGIVVVADTIASSPFIITGNVISANRRTGIYLLGSPVEVLNNVIGLDAQHRKPLGNGASGIYAASSSFFLNIRFASHYAYVSGNYITSATYDSAANKTIIDTTHPPDFGIHSGRLAPYYFYYASDAPHPSGYGDGQYFLGMTQGANHLAVDGNLRGKWISVYVTQHKIDCCFDNGSTGSQNTATLTGEFSRAVQVK